MGLPIFPVHYPRFYIGYSSRAGDDSLDTTRHILTSIGLADRPIARLTFLARSSKTCVSLSNYHSETLSNTN